MILKGLRNGARVMDKLSKRVFDVKIVDDKISVVDKEGNPVGVITDETVETYRYLGNDTPAPKPAAKVTDDGKLIVDGETIVTGQLKPVAVFPVRGKVLVLVKPLEKTEDGIVDIFEYDPVFDKFTNLLSGVMNPLIKEISEGLYLIMYNNTYGYTIKAKDKDETDKVITALSNAAIVLYNEQIARTVKAGETPVPVSFDDIQIEEQDDKIIVVLESTQDAVPLALCDDCDDRDNDDNDRCDDENIFKLVDLDGKTRVIILCATKNEDGGFDSWTANEWLVTGNVTGVTDAMDGSYLIVTDKEVIYTNYGHRKRVVSDAAAVQAAQAYPYLINAIVKNDGFTLKLADEQRNTMKITSKDTKDRGTLVTIE